MTDEYFNEMMEDFRNAVTIIKTQLEIISQIGDTVVIERNKRLQLESDPEVSQDG